MVYAKLYGVNNPKKRVESLSSDLVIDQFLDRPFGELSSGQKTRVSLAKSLLNNPDLLFLDEPTASLDPDTADWIVPIWFVTSETMEQLFCWRHTTWQRLNACATTL